MQTLNLSKIQKVRKDLKGGPPCTAPTAGQPESETRPQCQRTQVVLFLLCLLGETVAVKSDDCCTPPPPDIATRW